MVVRADFRVVRNGQTNFDNQGTGQVNRQNKDRTFKTRLKSLREQPTTSHRRLFVQKHLSAAAEQRMVGAGRRALRSLGEPAKRAIHDAVDAARKSGAVTDAEAAEMGPMIAGVLKAYNIG